MNNYLSHICIFIFCPLMMVSAMTGCTVKGELSKNSGTTYESNAAATDLKENMRVLWEDNAVWTRNMIECLVDRLPGTEDVINRLLQNQDDIGNAIKPYYGFESGNKLSELLKMHITIEAAVINAAKSRNSKALIEADKKWHANADEICALLSAANPGWNPDDLKMMMDDHLKLTTDEAVQRIKKNYKADITAFDKVQIEIMQMSDMISDGIVKQFSGKFNGEHVQP